MGNIWGEHLPSHLPVQISMSSAIATSLKKQQALGPQPSSRLSLWSAPQRGTMESQMQTLLHSLPPLPLLHQSNECDKKPESAQPFPPGPSLSQRVLGGNHVLRGAV